MLHVYRLGSVVFFVFTTVYLQTQRESRQKTLLTKFRLHMYLKGVITQEMTKIYLKKLKETINI